jgi:hypothetical protein
MITEIKWIFRVGIGELCAIIGYLSGGNESDTDETKEIFQ